MYITQRSVFVQLQNSVSYPTLLFLKINSLAVLYIRIKGINSIWYGRNKFGITMNAQFQKRTK